MTGLAAVLAIAVLVTLLAVCARGSMRRPAERAGLAALCLIAVPCLFGLAAVAAAEGIWPAAAVAGLAATALAVGARPHRRDRPTGTAAAPVADPAPPAAAGVRSEPSADSLREAA